MKDKLGNEITVGSVVAYYDNEYLLEGDGTIDILTTGEVVYIQPPIKVHDQYVIVRFENGFENCVSPVALVVCKTPDRNTLKKVWVVGKGFVRKAFDSEEKAQQWVDKNLRRGQTYTYEVLEVE